jgi:hypothetical protein
LNDALYVMSRSRALSQCLDIQNLAYETAMGFKTLESTEKAVELHARKCVALAQAARAWESAVDRARILRGRPLPGSRRHASEKPQKNQKMPRIATPKKPIPVSDGPVTYGPTAVPAPPPSGPA